MAYPNLVDLARAWNGDFITTGFKCAATERGMVTAVGTIRDLFAQGGFPRNFAAMASEDTLSWMQQGRAALTLQSFSRTVPFNDPSKSRFPGQIKTMAIPIPESLRDKFAVAPAKVEIWGMALPKNSARKDLAWSFIKHVMSPESMLTMTFNGNSSVRRSTFEDPRVLEDAPYSRDVRRVLDVARIPLPAFDNAQRAADLFKQEAEAAVLGIKSVEEAMTSLCQQVTPLLPG